MIFSENWFPPFGIMRLRKNRAGPMASARDAE
jgi:hypothetical protein